MGTTRAASRVAVGAVLLIVTACGAADQPEAKPPDQTTTSPGADRQVTAHLTLPDGWEYDLTFTFSAAPISAVSDISNSPPGQAQLQLRADMLELSYVGTLEGRNPPELRFPDVEYVWADLGVQRFDEASQCRRHSDGDIDIANSGGMVVWCRTLPVLGGTANIEQLSSQYAEFLNSRVEASEAGVAAWVDYFARGKIPDYIAIVIATPCTLLVGYDGSVRLITASEATTTGLPGSADGCQARPA